MRCEGLQKIDIRRGRPGLAAAFSLTKLGLVPSNCVLVYPIVERELSVSPRQAGGTGILDLACVFAAPAAANR
jgi:hypothetical protein